MYSQTTETPRTTHKRRGSAVKVLNVNLEHLQNSTKATFCQLFEVETVENKKEDKIWVE